MPLVDDRTKEIVNILATCVACAKDCAKKGNADMATCIALCNTHARLRHCRASLPLTGITSMSACSTSRTAVGTVTGPRRHRRCRSTSPSAFGTPTECVVASMR